MSDTHDTKKPKKGLSRFKLEIPLLSKGRKKPNQEEKKAAEFLSIRRGNVNEAVQCSPDSGVGVVIDKDQAVIQVELPDTNDDKEGEKELDAPPAELSIAELYRDCFKAKRSYQLALNAFIAHENKRGSAAASPKSSPQTSTPVPEPDVPTEMSFRQLEEDIEQMGGDVDAAIEKLQDVKGERNERQQEHCRVVQGLRSCFHNFAENARNVKSYLSLVPKSAGFGLGGLICGGISIVLKAAERYVLMDKHMEAALAGIKEALVHKAYVFERHEPDQRLHRLVSGLFARIFGVLESLLEWVYQQGTGIALLEVTLRPETYGQALAELIADMKRRSGAVERYGRQLELSELKKKMNALMGMEEKTHGAVQKVLRRQSLEHNMLEKLVEGQARAEGERMELQSQLELLTRLLRANVVQTLWALIAQDPPPGRTLGRAPVKRLVHANQPAAPRTRKLAQAAKPRLDPAYILAEVGFKPDLVPGDSRDILRAGQARLSTHDDQLVDEMVNHLRLQALVEVPSSSVLFVEGGPNGRHEARGPISVATARVAAALARGRETNPSLYALVYFCSEHRSARQKFGSAMELVITLLLQLIDQRHDFDPQLLEDCRNAVKNAPAQPSDNEIHGFCDLLQRCVLALPQEATLFCVVEGIAFFEGPRERTEHTRIILSRLLELGDEEAEAEEARARVKCLFTTPARSPEFIGLFQPYDVLTMQVVNSSGFYRKKSWVI